MSRILVAIAGTIDHEAVREALDLLGPNHDYLFLTVEKGVTSTARRGRGSVGPRPGA